MLFPGWEQLLAAVGTGNSGNFLCTPQCHGPGGTGRRGGCGCTQQRAQEPLELSQLGLWGSRAVSRSDPGLPTGDRDFSCLE